MITFDLRKLFKPRKPYIELPAGITGIAIYGGGGGGGSKLPPGSVNIVHPPIVGDGGMESPGLEGMQYVGGGGKPVILGPEHFGKVLTVTVGSAAIKNGAEYIVKHPAPENTDRIKALEKEAALAKEVMQHDREYIDELMDDAARIDWMDKACSKGGPGMRLEYEPGGLREAIDKEMGK